MFLGITKNSRQTQRNVFVPKIVELIAASTTGEGDVNNELLDMDFMFWINFWHFLKLYGDF